MQYLSMSCVLAKPQLIEMPVPKGSVDTASHQQVPASLEAHRPGSPVDSQGPTAIPDTVSNQADLVLSSHTDPTLTQGTGSVSEPGQSTDPRTRHSSDKDTPEDPNREFWEWLADQSKCLNCFSPEGDQHVLKKCTRCKIATYCNRECQVEHWPEHRQSRQPCS